MDEVNKICPFCDKIYSNSKIKPHIASEHLGMKASKNSTKESGKTPSKRKKIQNCDQCEKSFFDAQNLKRHTNTIHRKNTKYKCEECFKVFNRRDNLSRHFQISHEIKRHIALEHLEDLGLKALKNEGKEIGKNPSKRKKVQNCDKCEKSFFGAYNLQRHINTIHRKNTKYNCEKCFGVFNRNDNLSRHLQTKHEIFKCDHCAKTFFTKSDFTKHAKIFHEELMQKCIRCFKLFSDKNGIRRHFKSVHKSDKESFDCDICSKVFNRKDNLKRHKKFHKVNQQTNE